MSLKHSLEISEIRKNSKNSEKIIFVSGKFNIIHPGHLRLLRFAKECGDYLVVGVNEKDEDVVIEPELRLEGVKSISFVDYAFVLKESAEKFIEGLKPHAVVKGKEHETKLNPEAKVLENFGGKMIFSSGDITFSSLDLLSKEFKEVNFSTIKKPLDFPKRHKFTFEDLKNAIQKFSNLRVCVLGDLIIDEYITCDPLGMSQEDPTIVVAPVSSNRFVGGAGIVASHAAGLGAKVTYFSVVGNDEIAKYAEEYLSKNNVDAHLFHDESRPTTLKQRYRASGKTLLRVSHLRQHDISIQLIDELYNSLCSKIKDFDLVIFSDFNYGCLPQTLVDRLIELCKKNNIITVADSQSSSQVGDVSRYKGLEFITPTEREARLAMKDFNSGLVVLAESLRKKTDSKNIFITLGAEGLLIHAEITSENTWLTDRLPSFNMAPKDTAGAGDSFLTASSMAYALGYNIWQSSYIGSLAAACQVGRIGNIPLTQKDLLEEISGGL